MASLRLPKNPDRTELGVFWFGATVGLGTLGVLVGLAIDLVPVWLMTVIVIAGSVLGFYASTDLVKRAYRGWDQLAAAYGRICRHAVLRVMHLSVIWVARGAGSRLPREQPTAAQSGWRPRETLSPSFYESEGAVGGATGPGRDGWVDRLSAWALRSGQEWSIAVVPFLILLRGLDVEESDEPAPRDIYTLY